MILASIVSAWLFACAAIGTYCLILALRDRRVKPSVYALVQPDGRFV